MEQQNFSFMGARDITGKALRAAEAQMPTSGFKQRLHRRHELVKCEKHIKDTVEQLRNLNELFSQIQTPPKNASLYQDFVEYYNKFIASLTKLMNQFESYMRPGSKHFAKEDFNKYTSFFYHIVVVTSDEFWKRFKEDFPDVNGDGDALIDTVGFSSPDYVSKYDLDIFTSYVFRISMSRSGYWSIGYVSAEGKITQVLCLTSSLAEYLFHGKQQGLFKYPKGQACLDDLSDVSKMRVKVELQRRPGEDEDLLTCESSALCYQCNSKILCTTPIEIRVKTIETDFTPLRFKNNLTGGGSKNQDILMAAERVAATCGRDQEAVETDMRVLCGDGYGLEQVVDALISTGGDRAKAREYMLNSPRNQDILRAAVRVAATCGRDQEAVETDLRILYGDGYGLEQVVDALISTGGDRAKAKEMLR
ncbi:unnamed protein product [Taenia asiatica]|uniref:E3 ubiquitin-protein ligase CBL n=1 Tax=Taenia asiatica TaxID=60517 RepID=A0A0R3VUK3_TAEAS|nr:unnamed protein product [Taenia asiatica]